MIPSGTLDDKQFVKLVSKSNGFSEATIEGRLQAVTDELKHWLKQGWIVEVGELGHFSLSLKCNRPVMEKSEIRSPSIRLNKANLRIGSHFRKDMERLELERMESPYRPTGSVDADRCRTLLLRLLDEETAVTRSDFVRATGISRAKAVQLLNQYLEEGVIRKCGGGRNVVYVKK